jgi:hypothetical protein
LGCHGVSKTCLSVPNPLISHVLLPPAIILVETAKFLMWLSRYFCRSKLKKNQDMKLATRRHRVLAIIFGIALLITLVLQILQDGRVLETKNISNIQSIKK